MHMLIMDNDSKNRTLLSPGCYGCALRPQSSTAARRRQGPTWRIRPSRARRSHSAPLTAPVALAHTAPMPDGQKPDRSPHGAAERAAKTRAAVQVWLGG